MYLSQLLDQIALVFFLLLFPFSILYQLRLGNGHGRVGSAPPCSSGLEGRACVFLLVVLQLIPMAQGAQRGPACLRHLLLCVATDERRAWPPPPAWRTVTIASSALQATSTFTASCIHGWTTCQTSNQRRVLSVAARLAKLGWAALPNLVSEIWSQASRKKMRAI